LIDKPVEKSQELVVNLLQTCSKPAWRLGFKQV